MWLFALAALPCVAGCSDSGVKTVPVYGQVAFVGRDFPTICRLYFRPTQTESINRPSSTVTEPVGTYEVKAFRDSKGLVPGTYEVQVSYFDLKPGANPDLETSYVESAHDAGELVVDANADEVEHNIEVPANSGRAAR